MHRCSQVAGSLLAFLLFLALELIRLPSQSLVHSLLFFIGYFCICLSTGRKCDLNFLVWHWLDTWVQIPRLFITSVCENLFGSLQHILFIFCVLEQKEIKKKKAICTATVRSIKQYCKRQRSSYTFPVPLLVQQYLCINQFHYFC